MIFIVLLLIFLFLVYKIINFNHYWKRKGVPYIQPLPILGNLGPTVLSGRPWAELINDLYKAFPDKRYIGMYNFTTPVLFIRDLQLIKRILIKDFSYAPNHNLLSNGDNFSKTNIFGITVENGWSFLRSTLSPSFTSGKLKQMFPLIDEHMTIFLKYIEKQGQSFEIETKKTFTKYTNDVVVSTIFGITNNSFEDPQNDFYVNGQKLVNFSEFRFIKLFAYSISPFLSKLFKIEIFPENLMDFLRNYGKNAFKYREENQFFRPDMINLLIQAKRGLLNAANSENVNDVDGGFSVTKETNIEKDNKGPKITLDDNVMTSQIIAFYFASFETMSTFLCFAAYELAVNPDVQKRLIEEIDVAFEEGAGKITYENLFKMTYLDMVVSEILRKWPSATFIDRICTKTFKIEAEDGYDDELTVEKGTVILIPLAGINKDANYYRDPEKFDPERFSEENKKNITPYSYMPFGTGPRNCIGSRFALLNGKLFLTKLLRYFELRACEKTEIPPKMGQGIFIIPKKGIWLKFIRRQTSF